MAPIKNGNALVYLVYSPKSSASAPEQLVIPYEGKKLVIPKGKAGEFPVRFAFATRVIAKSKQWGEGGRGNGAVLEVKPAGPVSVGSLSAEEVKDLAAKHAKELAEAEKFAAKEKADAVAEAEKALYAKLKSEGKLKA